MKTLAIRLEDDLHAQLSVIAQLSETTLTDEIRSAIENHVAARRSDPELNARADAVRIEIDREAQARQEALASLFGNPTASAPSSNGSSRKARTDG